MNWLAQSKQDKGNRPFILIKLHIHSNMIKRFILLLGQSIPVLRLDLCIADLSVFPGALIWWTIEAVTL